MKLLRMKIPAFVAYPILLLAVACAGHKMVKHGAQTSGFNPFQIDTPQHDWMGFVHCDPFGIATGWINLNVNNGIDDPATDAHERKHIEQIKRYVAQINATGSSSNCWAGLKWIEDNVLIAEAEAFCEDVKIEIDPAFPKPLSPDSARAKYAEWLRFYSEPPIPHALAVTLMKKFC